MGLRRLQPSGWGGRGAAGPRPVLWSFTVSTRQAAPRGRFPPARRLPALLGPPRLSGPAPLRAGRGTDLSCPRGRTAVTIRRRAASKRAPSIDARRGPRRYASHRLHRSTTARRRRGTWIRRPPHRRDAPILNPPRPQADSGRCRRDDVQGKQRVGRFQYAGWRRICSAAIGLRAEVHHEGHKGYTKDTKGPTPPRRPSGSRHEMMPGKSPRRGAAGALPSCPLWPSSWSL